MGRIFNFIVLLTAILLLSLYSKAEGQQNSAWDNTNLSLDYVSHRLLSNENCNSNPDNLWSCMEALNYLFAKANKKQFVSPRFKSEVEYKIIESFPTFKIIQTLEKQNEKILEVKEARKRFDDYRLQKSIERLYWKSYQMKGYMFNFNIALSHVLKEVDLTQSEKQIAGEVLNAYLMANDPHAAALPLGTRLDMTADEEAIKFVGLGIYFSIIKGHAVIDYVYDGSGADEAGIRPNDSIVAVNDTPLQPNPKEALDMLMGEEGTTVNLTILRGGELLDVQVTRKQITVNNITSEIIESEKGHPDILYVKVIDFLQKNMCQQFAALISAHPGKSLLLDLRGNGGGSLDEAICMLDLFTKPGELLLSVNPLMSNATRYEFRAERPKIFNQPIVILVNLRSASASEVFSGVLQELNMAIVVGDRTFGKGTVQNAGYFNVANGYVLKMREDPEGSFLMKRTTASFHFPSGYSPQFGGVIPDVSAFLHKEPVEFETVAPREQDIYNAIKLENNKKPKNQSRFRKKVIKCVDKTGKAKEVFNNRPESNNMSYDYQFLRAMDVVACL